MLVREEMPPDYTAVYELHSEAFETEAEARLVDALRTGANRTISLVAEESGKLVGHIFFSPVIAPDKNLQIAGLAPMAVSKDHRNSGIGSALVKDGLIHCQRQGFGAAVVLGHPRYYPRFGFVPAIKFGIESEYEAPSEAFMALELVPNYLKRASGVVRYHAAFAAV